MVLIQVLFLMQDCITELCLVFSFVVYTTAPPHWGFRVTGVLSAWLLLHPQRLVCRWALGSCLVRTCRVKDAVKEPAQQLGETRSNGSDSTE
jgi:hypothetical protein